jgi:hypothetical protein
MAILFDTVNCSTKLPGLAASLGSIPVPEKYAELRVDPIGATGKVSLTDYSLFR